MKRYFARTGESDLGIGFVFFEFDGDTATRQIETYRGRWFHADDPYVYHNEIGPGLIDRSLSELLEEQSLTPEHEIAKEEFEDAWQEALKQA